MMLSLSDRDSRQEVQLYPHSQRFVQPMQRSQPWLSRSKNLDLALLAGCSCLLTVLYHPVADAFASQSATPSTSSGSAASTAGLVTPQSQSQPSNSFQLTLPQRKLNAKRDLKSDDD